MLISQLLVIDPYYEGCMSDPRYLDVLRLAFAVYGPQSVEVALAAVRLLCTLLTQGVFTRRLLKEKGFGALLSDWAQVHFAATALLADIAPLLEFLDEGTASKYVTRALQVRAVASQQQQQQQQQQQAPLVSPARTERKLEDDTPRSSGKGGFPRRSSFITEFASELIM